MDSAFGRTRQSTSTTCCGIGNTRVRRSSATAAALSVGSSIPSSARRDKAFTYAEGRVEYLAPDKGLFKTESLLYYTPPATAGEKPTYKPRPGDQGDHWICDGESIFEFDYKQEKLIQRELPPEMRGKAIIDGPLPFLFGAQAARIKARYWLQVITPPGTTDEYWLEAVPKSQVDAANYKKVEIIIAKEDYLPKAIQIYPSTTTLARTRPARSSCSRSARSTPRSQRLEHFPPSVL